MIYYSAKCIKKSSSLLLLLVYSVQLLTIARAADFSARLQAPYNYDDNNLGQDFSGHYPNNQGGPSYQYPSQTPIFQTSVGTKGGSKAPIQNNNQWWNWKNVVGPKQVPTHVKTSPPYIGQKTYHQSIDNPHGFGYSFDTNYNQPPSVDHYGQSFGGKIRQLSAPVFHRPEPPSNWMAPSTHQPIMTYEAFSFPSTISQGQDLKGQVPFYSGPSYPWYSNARAANNKLHYENYGPNDRPRFLGFGSVQRVDQGRSKMRLICRFDEPLLGYDTIVYNVTWIRFLGDYNPTRLEPSYDCQESNCQPVDVSDNPRFKSDLDFDAIYTLTIDDVGPEDYGTYRCSAVKANLKNQFETVYQIIPFKNSVAIN